MNIQLYLNFEDYDQPNDSGVYADCETLELRLNKSHIKAQIHVAFTPKGFCWGSGAMLENEGFAGRPSIWDKGTATRAEAIKRACSDIYRHVSGVNSTGARAVMRWVEQVQTAQA